MTKDPCPCGLPAAYDECCGRFHSGLGTAPTAERLMRSRYSAFAKHDRAYLLLTWHSSTRPEHLDLDPRQQWTDLQILARTGGGLFDATGTVEFEARYQDGARSGVMRELSRFAREAGAWRYVDAV
jgi:SEC-C motif-containing protein